MGLIILKISCSFTNLYTQEVARWNHAKVVEKLEELAIPFEVVEHEPAPNDWANGRINFIEGIEGVRTKTMFLTNKKKTAFYLVIMDDKKRLDMDVLKDLIGADRIRMAFSLWESLWKMSLPAGVVSPFGLLNNADKDIQGLFRQRNYVGKTDEFSS